MENQNQIIFEKRAYGQFILKTKDYQNQNEIWKWKMAFGFEIIQRIFVNNFIKIGLFVLIMEFPTWTFHAEKYRLDLKMACMLYL